ncbi:hypothetical protein [Xanthomonas theicola]|nr:hypothetical protein [Xanthomonas theicola]QNH24572.1 hypothetical protein G4Q83_07185 [Xanthomonas theicola]
MQRVTRRRYTDDFKAQTVALAKSIGLAKMESELAGCGQKTPRSRWSAIS